MSRVVIGTSGYSYRDWVGPVYPEGTDTGDFLRRYAERFRFTELNFPYYRMPPPGQLASLAAKVPAPFLFSVKTTAQITHKRKAAWREDAQILTQRVVELGDQFAGLLAQFPFSFHYDTTNRRYLADLADALPRPLFVEFRNAEWEQSSVYGEMERRSLSLVATDLPRLPGLPVGPPRLTTELGYIRMHGRNAENWWTGTNVSRYDYLYSGDMLREWAESIRALSADAQVIYVAFNNHFAGQAVTNAEQLERMLAG